MSKTSRYRISEKTINLTEYIVDAQSIEEAFAMVREGHVKGVIKKPKTKRFIKETLIYYEKDHVEGKSPNEMDLVFGDLKTIRKVQALEENQKEGSS